MNKTIFNIDEKLSIIILSLISLFFSFVSICSPITGLISFLIVLVKSVIFIILPFIIYVMEKNSEKFKNIAGIYLVYFSFNLLIIILASVLHINEFVWLFFKFLFDLFVLLILLTSFFVFIDYVLQYVGIKSRMYSIIMKMVYVVANCISFPFLRFLDKKIINSKREK